MSPAEVAGYKPRDGSVAQRVIWFLEANGASSTSTICDGVEDVTRSGLPACLASALKYGALFIKKVAGEAWYDIKAFAADGVDMDEAHKRKVITVDLPDDQFESPAAAAAARKRQHPDTPQGGVKAKSLEREAVQGPRAEPDGAMPAPPPPTTSPGVGPMGAGQAADAAPVGGPTLPPRDPRVRDATDDEIARFMGRAAPVPFSCALFSDGRLLLNLTDGSTKELDVEETRVLCHYLDRLSPPGSTEPSTTGEPHGHT